MDVVYRYRAAGAGEELKFSLRSLQNIPHDNVWIVGDIPYWLSNARTIKVPQNGKSKWDNSRQNVIEACKHPDVSDQFILMDDDFYITQPIDEIPVWHRGSFDEAISIHRKRYPHSKYLAGMIETNEILKITKLEQPIYAYNLHIPMVIDKAKLLECLSKLEDIRPKSVPQCFHLRSWYGNCNAIGGVRMSDVKISSPRDKIPEGPFISTSNSSATGEVRNFLKRTFPRASPYEGRRRLNGTNNRRRP